MRRFLILLFAFAACACGDATTFEAAEVPTYHGEVASILAEHCFSCHTEGNIAPIALDDYQAARAVAPLIKSETHARTMPPFLVSEQSDCQTYKDSPALTEDEIAVLAAWADGGAPEGTPGQVVPEAPPTPSLDDPTVVLDPGDGYTPPSGRDDDYRCFIVDPDVDTDMFLTAYEVRPDAIAQVHHVVLYTIDTDAEESLAHQLDEAEPGPGYTCFGGSGTLGGRSIAVWAPGTGATRFPDNTGLRLLSGRELIMQVHYNLGTQSDRTTVALELASNVTKEGVMTAVFDVSLQLPPGMASATESAAIPVPPVAVPVTLHGVYPHMHRYGTRMRAYWDRGDESVCLLDVPQYDFNWQQFFFYNEGVVIEPPGGGFLRIECEYDTRGAMGTVRWGEGTADEMCIAGFYATY
jgi:hypothetical protein